MHVGKQHGKKFHCDQCKFETKNILVLKAHVRSKHESKREYCCEQCEFKANNDKSLKKHIGSTHGEHQCDECNFKTLTKRGLKIHESRIHKLAGNILGPEIQIQNKNKNEKDSNSSSNSNIETKHFNAKIPSSHHEPSEEKQSKFRENSQVKVPAGGGGTRSSFINNNNDLSLDKSFCLVQNCIK